ncbi:MAG: hypothetical protein WCI71_00205 [Bacteroidota bacterium]
MSKKSKRILLFILLLLFSIVVVALGLKYFPFTRVVKLPASAEKEFANPQQIYSHAPKSLYFDFEIPAGKEAPGGMYKGIAHSGQYSVKAFGQNTYSLTIERTAGEIGVENLKAVAMSAWIYVFPTKNEVKGTFVFAASNELGVNVCWQGINIRDPEVPRGKWFKISGYSDLASVNFKSGYKLQVYFWNNSQTDILIDDYYIVFGGPVDRRGDSALVDMTRGAPFTPRFNFPPWQVTYLEKAGIDNPVKPAEFMPDAPAIAGNFLGTGHDDLITTGPDGKLALFTFCQAGKEFRKVVIVNTGLLAPLGKIKKIVRGKFIPGTTSQFIICSEKNLILAEIEPLREICSAAGNIQATLKILSKSDCPAASLCAGDFDGDHLSEILTIAPDGTWTIMTFSLQGKEGGAWKNISETNAASIPEWNSNKYEYSVIAGRFLPAVAGEIILAIVKNKENGKRDYTMRKYTNGYWIPVFPEKQGFTGKTIGPDTLKPSDQFFILDNPGNSTARVFRYNRDWRYDMKEIRFNDTTFTILSAIDFRGFQRDQNPKYYESLLLVPGSFIPSVSPGFIVSGCIARERKYETILPGFTAVYSIPMMEKNK